MTTELEKENVSEVNEENEVRCLARMCCTVFMRGLLGFARNARVGVYVVTKNTHSSLCIIGSMYSVVQNQSRIIVTVNPQCHGANACVGGTSSN